MPPMSSVKSMMDAARQLLTERFGFADFRDGQAAVVEHLLAGRSAAAVLPTGSGKSLCYQLPSLLLPHLTVVVSPLIALMKDQIDKLRQLAIPAASLDSSLSWDELRAVERDVRGSRLKLLFVSPERFNNERFRAMLRHVPISLFTVDEAHCISEWGHNFRPDYLKLAQFAHDFGAERILALTATATPDVLNDIKRAFGVEDEAVVKTPFYRPNLTLLFHHVAAHQRNGVLLEFLQKRPRGRTIVYVTLQKTAEEVAGLLHLNGLDAEPYHAGMEAGIRAEIQDWFATTDNAIVAATIAFGMGIDRSDIRYVYHYNMAKSLEGYAQEIGRAGRDGQPALCDMLVCPEDLQVLEDFARADTPLEAMVQSLVAEIFAGPDLIHLAVSSLATRHGMRPLVAQTLGVYLETEGFLEGGTPIFSKFQFAPLASAEEILERFDASRQDFLKRMLSASTKSRKWYTLDIAKAMAATSAPRERIVRAMDYLADRGLIDLRTSGMLKTYRVLRRPTSLTELGRALYLKMVEREKRDLRRLRQVMELAHGGFCQVAHLNRYFDSDFAGACGHCSHCLQMQREQWKS